MSTPGATIPVLDYHRKQRRTLRAFLARHWRKGFFVLRAAFIIICIHTFLNWDGAVILPTRHAMFVQARPQGLVFILLDDRYGGRPSYPNHPDDYIGSILAASNSKAFPYAAWITVPSVLPPLLLLHLCMTAFWFATSPRKTKN